MTEIKHTEDKITCPHCGKINDIHTSLVGESPLAGDISLCSSCHNISIFEKKDFKYSLIKVDEDSLTAKDLEYINLIRRALKRMEKKNG